MKKLSTIIMALALVLGMSQCKKQETPTTGNSTPGFYITVNVGDQDGKDGKDNNGEKHNIAPAYGLFAFTTSPCTSTSWAMRRFLNLMILFMTQITPRPRLASALPTRAQTCPCFPTALPPSLSPAQAPPIPPR